MENAQFPNAGGYCRLTRQWHFIFTYSQLQSVLKVLRLLSHPPPQMVPAKKLLYGVNTVIGSTEEDTLVICY